MYRSLSEFSFKLPFQDRVGTEQASNPESTHLDVSSTAAPELRTATTSEQSDRRWPHTTQPLVPAHRPRADDMEIDNNRIEKVRIVETSEETKATLETQKNLIQDLTQKLSGNEEDLEEFKKQMEALATKAALAEERAQNLAGNITTAPLSALVSEEANAQFEAWKAAEARVRETEKKLEAEERKAREDMKARIEAAEQAALERVTEAEGKANSELKARVGAEEQMAWEEAEARVRETEKKLEAEAMKRLAEEIAKTKAQAQERLQEERCEGVGPPLEKEALPSRSTTQVTVQSGSINASQAAQDIDQVMEDVSTDTGFNTLSDRSTIVDWQPSRNEEPVNRSTIPKPLYFHRPAGGAGQMLRLKPKAGRGLSPFNQSVSERTQSQTLTNDQRFDMLQTTVEKLCHTIGTSHFQRSRQAYRRQPPSAFKPPPTRRRSPTRTTKLGYVRNSMNGFLGISHDKDIIAKEQSTTPETKLVMEKFEVCEGEGPGPMLEPMTPNWTTLYGYWNSRIFDLFLEEYNTENNDDVEVDSDVGREIYDIFFSRLKHLQSQITQNQPKHGEDNTKSQERVRANLARKQRIQRPNTRRQALFDKRMKIVHSHIADPGSGQMADELAIWNKFDMVLTELGPEGMSSDESDMDDDGKMEYRTRRMPWRSKEVERRLLQIDKDRNTTNAYGNSRAGNQPRNRVRRHVVKISRRNAIPGYPLNFYDESWFAALTKSQQRDLVPTDPIEWMEFGVV